MATPGMLSLSSPIHPYDPSPRWLVTPEQGAANLEARLAREAAAEERKNLDAEIGAIALGALAFLAALIIVPKATLAIAGIATVYLGYEAWHVVRHVRGDFQEPYWDSLKQAINETFSSWMELARGENVRPAFEGFFTESPVLYYLSCLPTKIQAFCAQDDIDFEDGLP